MFWQNRVLETRTQLVIVLADRFHFIIASGLYKKQWRENLIKSPSKNKLSWMIQTNIFYYSIAFLFEAKVVLLNKSCNFFLEGWEFRTQSSWEKRFDQKPLRLGRVGQDRRERGRRLKNVGHRQGCCHRNALQEPAAQTEHLKRTQRWSGKFLIATHATV